MNIDPSAKNALQGKSGEELMQMLRQAMKNPRFVDQINRMGLGETANALQQVRPEELEQAVKGETCPPTAKKESGHGSK